MTQIDNQIALWPLNRDEQIGVEQRSFYQMMSGPCDRFVVFGKIQVLLYF